MGRCLPAKDTDGPKHLFLCVVEQKNYAEYVFLHPAIVLYQGGAAGGLHYDPLEQAIAERSYHIVAIAFMAVQPL